METRITTWTRFLPELTVGRAGRRHATEARYLLARSRGWHRANGFDGRSDTSSPGEEVADPIGFYRRRGGALLIARLAGQPVGVIGVLPRPGRSDIAELRSLFVVPEDRGYGAGRALVRRATDLARSMGFVELVGEASPTTAAGAWRLGRELGFVPTRPTGHGRTGVPILARLVLPVP